ncbi:MAG: hypothetical protein QGI86_09255 [Candidatus Poribacteria bacterium]|nr:hypothetical protein [Candidatus Poribacteria bacterium]
MRLHLLVPVTVDIDGGGVMVEEEATAETDLSQWRVLVVDDVAVNRVVVVRYLQECRLSGGRSG